MTKECLVEHSSGCLDAKPDAKQPEHNHKKGADASKKPAETLQDRVDKLSPQSAAGSSKGSSSVCSHEGRIEGHTLVPPTQYCARFNETECPHYWVPKGNCVWSLGRCTPDPRCIRLTTAPTGASYVFFKFHKVASSTVASTLRLALIGATGDPYTGCLHKQAS